MKKNYKTEAIENFVYIFNTYIKQFFPSSANLEVKTINNTKKVKRHIVKHSNKVLFYPCLIHPKIYGLINLDYRIASIEVVEYVLKEIMKMSLYTYDNDCFNKRRLYISNSPFNEFFTNTIYDTAFQVAICCYLTRDNTIGKTLLNLFLKLESWSTKTYEGKKIPFGFIIDCTVKSDSTYNYLDFLDNHSSAVFTDGAYGGILLDGNGNFIKYFSYEDATKNIEHGVKPFSPYNYIMFTENCTNSRIGILSLVTGDILLIKDKKLLFSKRGDNWIYYDYNRFRHIISKYIDNSDIYDKNNVYTNFIDQIYLTILDVSFSHTGGCLAITYYDKFDMYKNAIENDLLDMEIEINENDDTDIKAQKKKIRQRKNIIKNLTNSIPNTEFFKINRKLRQELLGLDGATVISTSGKLLASGAIVSIEGGSENGGRTAATKQLAKYGFAIKISEDGYIQCYGYNEQTNKVENILNFC